MAAIYCAYSAPERPIFQQTNRVGNQDSVPTQPPETAELTVAQVSKHPKNVSIQMPSFVMLLTKQPLRQLQDNPKVKLQKTSRPKVETHRA